VSRPRPHPAPVIFVAHPDLATVVRLLESAGLPSADLTEAQLEHFFYCGSKHAPNALIGIELYGVDALLRSLWVAPEARSEGVGSGLVEHVEDYARAQGVGRVYLLTTTAETFFEQLGYQRIERGAVAAAIQASREFRELCPSSSALLFKAL
jgi:amino-acid N-acetyltransferase